MRNRPTKSSPPRSKNSPQRRKEFESLSAGQKAHLEGIPDTLPEEWCPRCQVMVKPRGKGTCPRCNRLLKNSFLARKHPVNKSRRQQILDKLVAEYHPATTLRLSTCEHLAGILEQLENMKPGSPEHQRLVQLSQTLGDALEATTKAAPTASSRDITIRRTIVHVLVDPADPDRPIEEDR